MRWATNSAQRMLIRARRVLFTTPALASTVRAARALVHFGPWRHVARAIIRRARPPLHDHATRTPSPLSPDVPDLVRTLRADGMVRAGHVPVDVLRRVRAVTDELPRGEYGDFHEQPDVRALVADANVLNVVRRYFGAEPVIIECVLGVGGPEDAAQTPIHPQRHFHFDIAGWHALTLFVYLTDVEADSGAHQIVIGTHRRRNVRDAIRPWVPDDEIDARYPGRLRTITGPAGTMFFENTEAFHRRLLMKQRRAMIIALYASHRSLLSKGRLTPKYSDYVRARRAAGPTGSVIATSGSW